MKKNLNYKTGDVVFLNNDKDCKTPLQIAKVDEFSQEHDYQLIWMNSQRKLETMYVIEKLIRNNKIPEPTFQNK